MSTFEQSIARAVSSLEGAHECAKLPAGESMSRQYASHARSSAASALSMAETDTDRWVAQAALDEANNLLLPAYMRSA